MLLSLEICHGDPMTVEIRYSKIWRFGPDLSHRAEIGRTDFALAE